MPPRGRLSRGGAAVTGSNRGIQSYFAIPNSREEEKDTLLGKRKGEEDLGASTAHKRLHYEP